MKKLLKKGRIAIIWLLVMILTILNIEVNASSISENDIVSQNSIDELNTENKNSIKVESGLYQVPKLTKEQIAEKYRKVFADSNKQNMQIEDIFEVYPNAQAPYSAGVLKESFLKSGLDSINFARELAGEPSVELNEYYNEVAQYAAVLLAAKDSLTHYPSQPADMDDDFYIIGAYGCSHANLGKLGSSPSYGSIPEKGYSGLNTSILGYLNDGNITTLYSVGHRDWLLSLPLGQTGLGYAITPDGEYAYSAMYVMNASADTSNYDYDIISWPSSGNFPMELFTKFGKWSICFNTAKYIITDELQVTIIDPYGKQKTLSKENSYDSSYSSDYSFINIGGSEIVFRIGSEDLFDIDMVGQYTIVISGLSDRNNQDVEISFQTDFFSVESNDFDDLDFTQTKAFVERMYKVALNREAENRGLNDWNNKLLTKKTDAAGVAQGFICSQEFLNRNLNDNDYIDTLYRTFFDREADREGKNYWLHYLKNNNNRMHVLCGFVNSQEFSNLCDQFGIARGTMQENGKSIYNPGVRNFVVRMYTKALRRNGETMGIEDWTNRINTRVMTPEAVAKSFFISEEFVNQNLSDEEYVETLYQTFMNRASDSSGRDYWVACLRDGMSRDKVLEGFSRSNEFKNIMAEYGL